MFFLLPEKPYIQVWWDQYCCLQGRCVSYWSVESSLGSLECSPIHMISFLIRVCKLQKAWIILPKWRPWWTKGSVDRLKYTYIVKDIRGFWFQACCGLRNLSKHTVSSLAGAVKHLVQVGAHHLSLQSYCFHCEAWPGLGENGKDEREEDYRIWSGAQSQEERAPKPLYVK